MPPPSDERVSAALDLRLVPTAVLVWAAAAVVIVRPGWSVWVAGCALVFAVGLLRAWRLWAWRWGSGAVTRGWSAVTTAVVPAAGVVCAAIATRARIARARAHELADKIGGTTKVNLQLAGEPRPTEHGASAKAQVAGLPGEVSVFGDDTLLELSRDTIFAASAAVHAANRPSISGIQLTLRGELDVLAPPQGMAARVRQQLFESAQHLAHGPDRMIPAMAIGDERGFTLADREMMTSSGLSHLSAVSGANVALVVGAVIATLSWAGPRVRVLAAGMALIGFVAVVGTEPSVLRAVVTGCIGLLAIVLGRAGQAIAALSAGIIGLILIAPDLAVSVGFALSVAATAGLVLLAEPLSRRLSAKTIMGTWPAPVVRAIAVALVAHVVTAPVLALLIGQVSHVSLLANLLAAPAVAPVTIAGSLAAVAAAVHASILVTALLWCAAPFSWWIYHVARVTSALSPQATGVSALVATCALTAACLAALMVWPRVTLRSAAVLTAVTAICGAASWMLGLDIARAPQGWTAAACAEDGEVIVLHAGESAAVGRQCRIALGLSDDAPSPMKPPDSQNPYAENLHSPHGGFADTVIVESPSFVTEDLLLPGGVGEESGTVQTGAAARGQGQEGQVRDESRAQTQSAPKWIVAAECGSRVRRTVLTPSGIAVVCPQRDGPQALYPDGSVWRGGKS